MSNLMGYSPTIIDGSNGRQYLSIGSMMIPANSLPHPLAHMYPGSYVLPDGRLKVDPQVYKDVEEQQKYNSAVGELARKQSKPSKPVKKTKAEIYNEEAFPDKPKGEMSRLSINQRMKVKEVNDPILTQKVLEGDLAAAKGDTETEAKRHREVIESLKKDHFMVYIDIESNNAYSFNCLPHHESWLLQNITKKYGASLEDAFYYSEKDKHYFLKDKWITKCINEGWIRKDTSDLIYSNYIKTDKPPIIYTKSFDDGQKQIASLSQYPSVKSEQKIMTAEEYDEIAFK